MCTPVSRLSSAEKIILKSEFTLARIVSFSSVIIIGFKLEKWVVVIMSANCAGAPMDLKKSLILLFECFLTSRRFCGKM